MKSTERQIRILEYIEQYQRQNQDAPTIREIVRHSGVSTYANVNTDVEAIVKRGLAAFVSEQVSGSEPFSSRQLRLTGAASGASSRSASASIPPPPRPARRQAARKQQALPRSAKSTGAQRGRRQRSRGQIRKKQARTPGDGWTRSLPARVALGAAILATLLLIAVRMQAEPLPAEPAFQLGSRSIPFVVPGAIIAWALSGLAMGLAISRAGGPRPRLLLQAGIIGALSGAAVPFWEQALRPLLAPLDASGIPRLLDAFVYLLPAVLPAAFLPTPGVALAGVTAAEIPKMLAGSNFVFRNLLAVPLVAIPVELVLLGFGKRRDMRVLLFAGLTAGLSQSAISAAFAPGLHAPGMWPTVLASATIGGLAAAWASIKLREHSRELRKRFFHPRSGKGKP